MPPKGPQKNNFYSQRNSENKEQQLMVSHKTSPGINLQQDAKLNMANSRNEDKFVTQTKFTIKNLSKKRNIAKTAERMHKTNDNDMDQT